MLGLRQQFDNQQKATKLTFEPKSFVWYCLRFEKNRMIALSTIEQKHQRRFFIVLFWCKDYLPLKDYSIDFLVANWIHFLCYLWLGVPVYPLDFHPSMKLFPVQKNKLKNAEKRKPGSSHKCFSIPTLPYMGLVLNTKNLQDRLWQHKLLHTVMPFFTCFFFFFLFIRNDFIDGWNNPKGYKRSLLHKLKLMNFCNWGPITKLCHSALWCIRSISRI